MASRPAPSALLLLDPTLKISHFIDQLANINNDKSKVLP